jgi:hypothetical protein
MTGATAIVVLRLPVVRWFRDDGRLAEVATGVEEILRLLEEMSIAKSEWLRGGECQ